LSAEDILRHVSSQAKALRLASLMTQPELAARAGVSVASLRRFERTGNASFELVARIAMVLRSENKFTELFELPRFTTLDEAINQPPARKRGRRKRVGGCS